MGKSDILRKQEFIHKLDELLISYHDSMRDRFSVDESDRCIDDFVKKKKDFVNGWCGKQDLNCPEDHERIEQYKCSSCIVKEAPCILRKKAEWIKCSDDKLPREYDYVLVYARMKKTGEPCPISIARIYENKWEMLTTLECNAVACGDLTWDMDAEDITHWMPLPEVPNE